MATVKAKGISAWPRGKRTPALAQSAFAKKKMKAAGVQANLEGVEVDEARTYLKGLRTQREKKPRKRR